MAMSLPIIFLRCRADAFSKSTPLNVTSSAVTMPGASIKPMSAIIVTLLPEPDSPTTPTTSPGLTDISIRSTAGSPLKLTARLRMVRRSFMSRHPFEFGIECIAQPVAEQVDHQDRNQNGKPRHGHDPPRTFDVITRRREHCAPLRRRRLHAEAEKAERGGIQNGGRKA